MELRSALCGLKLSHLDSAVFLIAFNSYRRTCMLADMSIHVGSIDTVF